MILYSQSTLASILQSLGLAQGLFKPSPDALRHSSISQDITDTQPIFQSVSSGLQAGQAFQDYPPTALASSSVETLNKGDCHVQAYAAPNLTDSYAEFDSVKSVIYRYRQQQSVNLGSWFVHEQWMTPSTFTCSSGKRISELDIATGWGSPEAARFVLEKHWDTFVTQQDFDYLASIGINTVRLPISYWNLGPEFCQGTPFANVAGVYDNSWSRVRHGINMANQAGIGVLIDLHGAPGSQNGQPHSGISDGQTNLFDDPSSVEKTMQVLTFLMTELSVVTNIVGIQILNEPKNVDYLEDFYTEAINRMRNVSSQASAFPLYIHDGFDLARFSDYVANRSDFVVQDHHSYFVFSSSDVGESASGHADDIQASVIDDLENAATKQHRNLVVDEWSCALAPQSLIQESDKNGAQLRFCTGQSVAYTEAVAGWSFWAYMKEDCDTDPGWCFKSAVGKYLPTSFSSYPGNSSSLRILAEDPEQSFLTALEESVTTRGDSTDGAQFAISKGYSDGYQTAILFASYGMSRLGFTDQYIRDSLEALGPQVVAPQQAEGYRQWFTEGLRDGEASVLSCTSCRSM